MDLLNFPDVVSTAQGFYRTEDIQEQAVFLNFRSSFSVVKKLSETSRVTPLFTETSSDSKNQLRLFIGQPSFSNNPSIN